MPGTLPHSVIENGQVVADSHPQLLVPWWSFAKTLIAAAVLSEPGIDLDRAEIEGLSLRHLLRQTQPKVSSTVLATSMICVPRI